MGVTPELVGSTQFMQRWLFFILFAGTALLASTVVTEGVRAMAPSDSGTHGVVFAVLVHAVAGASLGALAAFRLRAGGTREESVGVDALALGLALAFGAAVAAGLAPYASTLRMSGAAAVWPVAAAGVAGAAIAARRGGDGAPLASVPLSVGQRAAAQQGLAALDTLQRVLARVADPSAVRPDHAETACFCDADEAVGNRCGQMPPEHAATEALRQAGQALTSAVELHYVAHGWHADLDLEPGDPEGIAAARRRWALDATDPVLLAGALADRARRERETVERYLATNRTPV